MNKISICGPDNCDNDDNHFHNCEDYIALRLGKINKSTLVDIYADLRNEFKLEKISSITSINGEPAQHALFERIILGLFGCHTLKGIVSEIKILNGRILVDKSVSGLLKEQKKKIENILYGNQENFLTLLQFAQEFSREFDSDLFVNVLIKIDAIYVISKHVGGSNH